MQNYASKVSEGMALQLGCLELRWVPLGFFFFGGGEAQRGAGRMSSREGFGGGSSGRGLPAPCMGGLCAKGKDVEGGFEGGGMRGDAWVSV